MSGILFIKVGPSRLDIDIWVNTHHILSESRGLRVVSTGVLGSRSVAFFFKQHMPFLGGGEEPLIGSILVYSVAEVFQDGVTGRFADTGVKVGDMGCVKGDFGPCWEVECDNAFFYLDVDIYDPGGLEGAICWPLR